jgi:high-affinity Fe2+/Pb2+ permease
MIVEAEALEGALLFWTRTYEALWVGLGLALVLYTVGLWWARYAVLLSIPIR